MREQAFLRRCTSLPWLTLFVLGAALVLYLWPRAADAFIFDRSALAEGQLWRLLTGHLVHLSAPHLIMDGAAFCIVAAAIERAGRPLGPLLLMLGAGIGGFLWWLLPQVAFYGGLSGINYGLFVYAAITLPAPRSRGRRAGQVAAGALAVKVMLEIGMQATWSCLPAQGFVPLPQSHAAGIIIVLLYWAGSSISHMLPFSCLSH